MLKQLRVAGIAVALMGVTTITGAQAKPAPESAMDNIHWIVGIGVAKPMSDLDSCCDIGFNLLGAAEYTLMPGWGVRGEVSYTSFGARASVGGGTASEVGGLVSGVYHPTIAKLPAMWKPYALAGIGYYNGTASGGGSSVSSGSFGFGVGGGTEVLLAGYHFFGEIRYIRASHSYSGFGFTSAWIPLTVGLRF